MGPSCFRDWQAHWEVFEKGVVTLGLGTHTRLAAYKRRISRLAEDYASLRWLIYDADIQMRRDRWRASVRIRKCNSARARHVG